MSTINPTRRARRSVRRVALTLGLAGGVIDTATDFATVNPAGWTLHFRFLPQYQNADDAFWVSSRGNNFAVGSGDHNAEPAFQRKVVLRLGATNTVYPVAVSSTDLAKNRWQHLAIVNSKSGSTTTWIVYLNGRALSRANCSSMCTVLVNNTVPSGRIRLGRLGFSVLTVPTNQAYGLLDDVALYRGSQSATQVQAWRSRPRVTNEANQVAVYSFDQALPDGSALPAHFKGGWTTTGSAVRSVDNLSQDRNSFFDSLIIPLALGQPVTMRLPVAPGTPWRVIQGHDVQGVGTQTSHHGYAAFSLDLVRDDLPNSETCQQHVFSATPGTVVEIKDTGITQPNDNRVKVRYAPDRTVLYLHLAPGSVPDDLHVGDPVVTGQFLGRVGFRNSCHLHFSVDIGLNTRDNMTYPFALFGYQRKSADGSFTTVSKGLPSTGDVIRR